MKEIIEEYGGAVIVFGFGAAFIVGLFFIYDVVSGKAVSEYENDVDGIKYESYGESYLPYDSLFAPGTKPQDTETEG